MGFEIGRGANFEKSGSRPICWLGQQEKKERVEAGQFVDLGVIRIFNFWLGICFMFDLQLMLSLSCTATAKAAAKPVQQ